MILAKHSLLVLVAMIVCATASLATDQKLSEEELVSKHLQSLGKSTDPLGSPRLFQGKAEFSEVIGKNIQISGTSSLISQDHKFKSAFRFDNPQYPGEQFVFDGRTIMIGMIDATSRSNLGTFLNSQEEILREGLFGGTLSTAWPLLDVAKSGAKLKYEGVRKIDGHELHDLLYVPKKQGGSGELTIHLYFEPNTFRHVMTIYTLILHDQPDGADESRRVLEEHFDDFRPTNGLMLPWHWTLRYQATPENKAQEFQWDSKFESFRVLPVN